VHPYGIDPERRSTTDRLDHVTRFLFVGRLDVYQKGLDLLVEAFRSVIGHSKRAELIIAGPGDPTPLRVGDLNGVTVLGPVEPERRRNLMAQADFFVHPSRWEVMARSAREAVAAGLPLIATRESNFGDWVAEFEMGIVAAATTEGVVSALVAAMDTSAGQRSKMRQNAASFADTHGWSHLAGELERRYREVAE
jgi:glycosyltransferase involved in cell wall biosynthesis